MLLDFYCYKFHAKKLIQKLRVNVGNVKREILLLTI